ncbi:hypothetical protein [Chryseobacterium vrystaatense]|uniref:DUF4407 domain-containing protein n=1 Tax=Chryseobacterium vrystaatense TaxID=307480 RepID=A0A1M5I8U0_9FLAO|nr:hypothetical protein [Chryseobacterium vrystaatense]KFF23376.1 hypothetical protein IW16_24170 [Chryseobacterium vrystaatense]SHG24696.1 hypothetical protein SAMN02787073_3781 [Chryseobacterium vrystaatense]
MNKKTTPADLFLGILALLLISVSFYQTWLGLQQIFGPASFVIALVLSLLLLFLCWMLRNAKLEGKPTGSLVGIYVFIASFCFIANFNALYTRFMKTDIYTDELRLINKSYTELENNIESKLSYKYNKMTAQNIEIKKKQMMEQIKDPGNKGIGERAQALIRDIEKLTGQKVDHLTPVGSDYEDLAERMGRQIDNMISDLSPEEQALKTDINNATLKWNKNIQELLLLSKKDKDVLSQGIIDESLAEYNKLGSRAQTVLGNEKIHFEPVVSQTQEVGKIGFAFEHAIKHFGMYQFVVLAGCILLDFVIVIIILLVTGPDNNRNNRGSVFNNKRSGNTLIPNN